MRIMPFGVYSPKSQIKNNKNYLSINFSSINTLPINSQPTKPLAQENSQITSSQMLLAPDWILNDPIILRAVNELKNLEFNPEDVLYVQSLGAVPPFKNGREAAEFIYNSNTRIKFSTLASVNIHAQYDYENNFIKINEIYKNTQNPAEILAIAEAILHESGHAKDKDGKNSVQEEIDCLSMNAISHRAFMKKYPDIFTNSDALIIKDGVCVYADLFFDADTSKSRLIERVKKKYSFLPVGDFTHSPSNIAMQVKMT